MSDPFERLGGVVKGAAGIVAIIPGIAVLSKAVEIPPTLQTLLGGLSIGLGVVVVLTVLLFSETIRRANPRFVGVIAVSLSVLGAIAGLLLFAFTRSHVIRMTRGDHDEYMFVPLRISGELATLVEPFRRDWPEAIMNQSVGPRVLQLMSDQSLGTMSVLALGFLLTQALIITAIVIGAWKVAESQ